MSRKRYTSEFKMEAVKQVTERGYSAKDVADRLGVSVKSIYDWKAQLVGEENDTRKLEKQELQKELVRLQVELRRVTEERDILKKAAAYFAKTSG